MIPQILQTLVADLVNLRLWLFVLIVSAVGLAEKLAIYRAGQHSAGADLLTVPGLDEERQVKLKEMFRTRGTYILLLASIPGLGAAMAAVAGFIDVAAATFVLWVTISILTRNWLIVILTGQIASLF